MSVFCKIRKRNKRPKQKRSLTLLHFQNTSRFLVLGKRNKKQKQERRLTTLLHFQNTSPLPGPGVASFFFHFVPAVFSCSNTRPRSYTTFSPLTTFCHGYSPTSTFVSVKASLRKPRQCLEAPPSPLSPPSLHSDPTPQMYRISWGPCRDKSAYPPPS